MKTLDEFLDRQFNNKFYNCSDFVIECWEYLTGENLRELHDRFRIKETREQLIAERKKLDSPVSPCLVLVDGPSMIPHVGIYYQGRMIHLNALLGVLRQDLSEIPENYNVSFYA